MATRTFQSLREAADLPPESLPTIVAAYAFSNLPSSLPDCPTLVDAATGISVSYPSFLAAVCSLACSLWSMLGLRPEDIAPLRIEDLSSILRSCPLAPSSRPRTRPPPPRITRTRPRCPALSSRWWCPMSEEYDRLLFDGRVPPPLPMAVKQSKTAASSGTVRRQ
ncbi:hypothetical protein PR202_ga21918 [Eleusine coracana subsp. coracana]|uniref:Uncharacterized protein n=1 Tax=Eleusine coracana subsp. coracana TaxID=191504 RepID=A0AAV5D2N8_ELECO|nr:hypothetical protein PR202_ga21918 [Eleusine coracana subsp. coracana]